MKITMKRATAPIPTAIIVPKHKLRRFANSKENPAIAKGLRMGVTPS
jgi:hypothetical protein